MKFFILLSLLHLFHANADSNQNITIQFVDLEGYGADGFIPDSDPNYVYDPIETNSLKLVLDLGRRMAAVGVGINGVPPFDPLSGRLFSPLKLGGDVSVDVSDVVVEGLKNYDFLNVSLESANLFPPSKLVKFDLKLLPLKANGDITVTLASGVLVGTLKLETGEIFNNGSLLVVLNDEAGHYEVMGLEIDNYIELIKIEIANIRSLNGRSRVGKGSAALKPLVNEITKVLVASVKKSLNKLLKLVPVQQVDAFLKPLLY